MDIGKVFCELLNKVYTRVLISHPQRTLEFTILGLIVIVIGLGSLFAQYIKEPYIKFAFSLLGIVSGAMFSLLLTSLFEVVRRPILRAEPGKQAHNPMSGQPSGTRDMQTLFITITNEELSRRYRWIVSRNPALGCYGKITFFEEIPGGYRQVKKVMTTRWRSLPQPGPLLMFSHNITRPWRVGGFLSYVHDMWRYDPLDQDPEQRTNIFVGKSQFKQLDAVCRWSNAKRYCFGFNNQFYCPDGLPRAGCKTS